MKRHSASIVAPILSVFLGLACGSSAESDDSDTSRTTSGDDNDGGLGDAQGPGGDEPAGGDDTNDGSGDDTDDASGDGSDDDTDIIVGDDEPDGTPDDEQDAGSSITDGSELPGGGFVSIDENDAGVIEILCGTEVCACADGEDNDGDGLADGADSECTGPFDHDEGSFATGIPGDNQDPKWQDCFFDGNSGAGDDGCRYHTDCITGEAEQNDAMCSASEQCKDYCEPLTPPGCDCFGCCQIDNHGELLNILVSDSCSLANIDDEAACPRCTPSESCGNECGECEICLGQTIEDLPDNCYDDPPGGDGGSGNTGGSGNSGGTGNAGGDSSGGSGNASGAGNGGSGNSGGDDPPPNVCDGGSQACLESVDCGSGLYCSLGCCKALPAR